MKRIVKCGRFFLVSFVSWAFFLFGSSAFADPVLHTVFVIDRDGGEVGADIGPGCQAGYERFVKILGETFEGKESRHSHKLITGDNVGPESVFSYINDELSVDSDDTIWFYYCGHGATDNDDGHFFATSEGNIKRDDLRDALESKGARLVVITSDACSSPGEYSYLPPRRSPAEWKAFNQLFFQHRGITDITAATAPDFAFINSVRGGFFGQAFMQLMCEELSVIDDDGDGFVTWEEGFSYVRNRTRSLYQDAHLYALEHYPDAEIAKQDDQVPYAFRIASATRPGAGPVRFSKELKIVNNTASPLFVNLRAYTYVNDGWEWIPGPGRVLTFKFEPGESSYLGNGQGGRLNGHKFVMSGQSGNLKFAESVIQTAPNEGYQAHKDDTYVQIFYDQTRRTARDVSVVTTHNVYRGGKKGMLIQVELIADYLKEAYATVNALFYFSNGNILKDSDGRFATSKGGQVGLAAAFKPTYLHTKYSIGEEDGIEMFMPYDQLEMAPGEYTLYFKLHMISGGHQFFTGSRQHTFNFSQK